MEPEQNMAIPETTVGIEPETVKVAEYVQITPTPQPPTAVDQTAIVTPAPIVETAPEVAEATVQDTESTGVATADKDWVGKVQTVIREDKGRPYKEEEDAEDLNEKYMKQRFNVDVDAPVEER